MQRSKGNKQIEQIAKISTSVEKITQSISDVIDKFDVKSVFKEVDQIKRCGILISTISMAMLILAFIGKASIAALFKSGLNKVDNGQKDVYYDIKNNSNINWRFLLLALAKRFKFLVCKSGEELQEISKEIKLIKAIILDDSAIEKTGKTIEGTGYVHDHTSNIHILGYKLLVCGFWDGISFIPLDFSLHREKRGKDLKNAKVRLDKKREKIKKLTAEVLGQREKKRAKQTLLKDIEKTYKAKGGKTNKLIFEQKQRVVARIDKRIQELKAEIKQQKAKGQYLANAYFELKSNYHCCGLKKEDYQNQYKKKRDRGSAGYKRKKEIDSNKIDNAV